MNLNTLKKIYFVGIGGIGMSALARYFSQRACVVKGYDLTQTDLTRQLEKEQIEISYQDTLDAIDKEVDLVVYTPAIPQENQILQWYKNNNYPVHKRSEVLQWITENNFAITVAGTHGKTTISTLTAYLLSACGMGCNAFLGGISVNYNSNYWSAPNDIAVIEADEYDRSFLRLFPNIAVLTAMDADHLDIYGTVDALEAAFIQYCSNIKPGGTLIVKHGLARAAELKASNSITYSLQNDAADVYAQNIVQHKGTYTFDIVAQDWRIDKLYLPIGGMHNIENTVAAVTICKTLDIENQKIIDALAQFKGVKRRFEYVSINEHHVYIDDYAHHPEELSALIKSAKRLFPNKKCIVAFQPHLYSRTRDLADAFAESLCQADQVILLDIYPAREKPIEGVSSQMIVDRMASCPVTILSKEGLLSFVKEAPIELLITAGAGDIDKLVPQIKNILEAQ